MKTTKRTGYRLVRRAGDQGTRPSVVSQAGVDKFATGCDSLSLSTITSGYKNTKESVKFKTKTLRIKVRTLQEDIKLATIIKVTESLNIDVLALQEVRRTGSDCLEFDDESLKGWQFAWSGYNVKKTPYYLPPMWNFYLLTFITIIHNSCYKRGQYYNTEWLCSY